MRTFTFMRALTCTFVLAGAILWAAPAQAQFANRGIGAFSGYMGLNEAAQLDWGVPVGLKASLYLDAGFEATVHVAGMFLIERISGRQILGVAGSSGLRYLFFQEHLRPYAGLDLSYLYVGFDDARATAIGTRSFVGLGPNVGVENFFWDNLSLGLRGQVNLYWWLNQPLQTSLSLTLDVTAYY